MINITSSHFTFAKALKVSWSGDTLHFLWQTQVLACLFESVLVTDSWNDPWKADFQKLIQVSCPFCSLAHRDVLFLTLKEVILGYSPALLDPSSLYGKFPWNSSMKVCEEAKASSYEVQGCNLIPCLGFLVGNRTPWSHGHWAKAAPTLTSPTRRSLFVLQGPAAHLSSLAASVSEVIVSAFQESPGLCVPVLALQQVSGWFPMRTGAACPSWEYPYLSWMGGVYNSAFVFPSLKLSLQG